MNALNGQRHQETAVRHYPRNIGDWIAATAHLSSVEECMYSRLIDQYYAREAPLPLDMPACCRLARAMTAAERKAVGAVVPEFFDQREDGWHQKRCDVEIAAYQGRSASASASAQKRWSYGNANAMRTHMPTHMPTHSDGNATRGDANQEPRTKNQEPKGKSKSIARGRATPLPEPFAISDRVRQWAVDKGHDRLDERLEAFVGKVRANGYTYRDWDEAFMNSVRDDWAKLNGVPYQKSGRAVVNDAIWGNRKGDDDAIDGTAERIA